MKVKYLVTFDNSNPIEYPKNSFYEIVEYADAGRYRNVTFEIVYSDGE